MLDKKILKEFVQFVKEDLDIKKVVPIKLVKVQQEGITTAGYFPNKKIIIKASNRHLVDILRSIAHELVHHKQMEDGKLVGDIPDIGGPIEDEANAVAGQLIKKFAKAGHQNIYEHNLAFNDDYLRHIITEEIRRLKTESLSSFEVLFNELKNVAMKEHNADKSLSVKGAINSAIDILIGDEIEELREQFIKFRQRAFLDLAPIIGNENEQERAQEEKMNRTSSNTKKK